MQSGSRTDPIQLEDDEEEFRKNQEKVQFERNRQALYQAHMGSQFDVLLAVLKLQIKGSEEEKNRVIKNRIYKFFNHGSKAINVQKDHFRQRRDPDYSNPTTIPVDNELILFGIDFLNMKQIKQKFIGLDIEIKCLDDSHCRIKFRNAEEAKRGIQINLKNKTQDIVKLENQEIQIPRNWFEFQNYFYMTFERRLFARYAASNEDGAQIEKSNDFYLFQQAKKKFQESISKEVELKYFEVMRKYKLVDEGKIRQKMRNRGYDQDRGRGERGRFNNEDNYYRRDRERQNNWERGPMNREGDRRNWNQRMEGKFNEYTQNRDRNNDFNRRGNQHREDSQENRSRNKRADKDLDNLSIISKPISRRSNNRRARKFSESICSNQSPIRNNEDINDDSKSSLSFIFNLDEQSSNRIVNDFNNLSIQEDQRVGKHNFSKKASKQMKQEQMNFSYISSYEQENGDKKNTQKEKNLNLSLDIEQSKIFDKNRASSNNVLNASILEQESTSKKNRMNGSIEQIIIYD